MYIIATFLGLDSVVPFVFKLKANVDVILEAKLPEFFTALLAATKALSLFA